MKRMAFALIISVVVLASMYSGTMLIAEAQGNTQGNSTLTVMSGNPVLSQLPPVPSVTGAAIFESTNFGPWIPTNFSNSLGLANNTTDAPMEGGNYILYGMQTAIPSISEGDTQVNFTQVPGERDNKSGANAWSIQLNTNPTQASNGYTYWIQFVFGNNYGYYPFQYSYFAIWVANFSHTPTTYTPYGKYVPYQSLTAGNNYYVTGLVQNGLLEGYFTYFANGVYTSVYEQIPDKYGLQNHWNYVDGTILGLGGGSTANFVSTTYEQTDLTMYPASSFVYTTSSSTAEQNNLAYYSVVYGFSQSLAYMNTRSWV